MFNVLSGIVGGLASNSFNNALSQENASIAYNRQRSLMSLQQQYAVQNWNREANYNSPVEQMKRLKEAGLNPNLVYGNGMVGLEAPNTSSPGSPGAPMAQSFPLDNPINEAAQAASAMAAAKKAGSEALKVDIESEYLKKTLEGRIHAVALQNHWTQEQTTTIVQQCVNLVAQQNMLRAQAEALGEDVKSKKIVNESLRERIDAEISKIKADKEYSSALAGLTDSQKKLLDSTMDYLVDHARLEKEQLETLVGLLGKYGDAQAIVGMISQCIGSVADVIASWKKFPGQK